MKATKIWIATHPQEPYNRVVEFSPSAAGQSVYIEPTLHSSDDHRAEYVEHVCIPLEDD